MSRAPVVVLGATGSIGLQTIDVAQRLGHPVAAIAAGHPSDVFETLRSRVPGARSRLAAIDGQQAIDDLARIEGAIVVNAIVGAVGLSASVAALEAGNRLALANKESIIAGAEVVEQARKTGGGELIPVDSEHSALYQLLDGRDSVSKLVITASGGPFRGRSRASLEDVSPAEALDHPTWSMGKRITIDSATLVNKGLEVIEAAALFGFGFDDIEVVVHPQSVVHAMVRLEDGSLLAHTGVTDMRVPIQYAVTHPRRNPLPDSEFDLAELTLTFEEPDRSTFPALDLAYRAGRAGRWATAAFNAADEVAVRAFLEGRIPFLAITTVIERVLEKMPERPMSSLEEVMSADAEARSLAAAAVDASTS